MQKVQVTDILRNLHLHLIVVCNLQRNCRWNIKKNLLSLVQNTQFTVELCYVTFWPIYVWSSLGFCLRNGFAASHIRHVIPAFCEPMSVVDSQLINGRNGFIIKPNGRLLTQLLTQAIIFAQKPPKKKNQLFVWQTGERCWPTTVNVNLN